MTNTDPPTDDEAAQSHERFKIMLATLTGTGAILWLALPIVPGGVATAVAALIGIAVFLWLAVGSQPDQQPESDRTFMLRPSDPGDEPGHYVWTVETYYPDLDERKTYVIRDDGGLDATDVRVAATRELREATVESVEQHRLYVSPVPPA